MSSANTACEFIETAFERQDDRFLAAFRQDSPHARLASLDDVKRLAELADRWKTDPRPWARTQLLEYLRAPFDRRGHHAVVKRFFKHAEETGDDEAMALFLVAFDRLVRRKRVKSWTWIQSERRSVASESLAAPRDQIVAKNTREWTDHRGRKHVVWSGPSNGRLFTYRTRYYLRRRVWRYFRQLAKNRPDDYCVAATRALLEYRPDDLATGENVLDSRGLVHLLFRGRSDFDFTNADHLRLSPRAALARLEPAPAFDELWSRGSAFEPLWRVATRSRCRLIAKSARALLERHHATALGALDADLVLPLLSSDDEETRLFGLQTLERSGALERLSVDRWLALLDVRDPTLLVTLAELFAKHVPAERTTLDQQVRLAARPAHALARVGADLLRKRDDWSNPDDRAQLTRLAEAECEAVAGPLAAWALSIVGRPEVYAIDAAIPFFDSLREPIRAAARAWLATPEASAAASDPVLWSRLLETPFDDVKRHLLTTLAANAERFASHRDSLGVLWSAVLLNVHRGARQKPLATRQLADAIVAEPVRAGELLPVLAAAVRSIRGPERRAGLAAVAALLERRPELEGAIGRAFPELSVVAATEGRS